MKRMLQAAPGKPGLIALRFPFHEMLRRHLVAFGAKWDGGCWNIAEEFYDAFREVAKGYGFIANPVSPPKLMQQPSAVGNPQLHRYQQEAVEHVLRDGRCLIAFTMGLGKTATGIKALRLRGAKTAVIVCPAVVRETWLDELDRWWPGHPAAVMIKDGKDAEAWSPGTAPIAITSYELFKKLPIFAVDGVVFDESHYLQSGLSQRSQSAKTFLDAQRPDSLRVLLTGTPIWNKVDALYNLLDTLYPGRYGTWHQFIVRYCKLVENPYAPNRPDIVGINESTATELHERVALVCHRVTEEEVAGLLPPVITSVHRVRPRRSFNVRQFCAKFTRIDAHRAKIDACINASAGEKVGVVAGLVSEKLSSGATHVLVYTHLRSTAEEIAHRLSEDLPNTVAVACVHGETPPNKRHAPLKAVADASSGVVVATMHAIGVGINELAQFTETIFAELDYTHSNLEQAAKRTNRLSSKRASHVTFVVLQGTQEEIIAETVRKRIEDAGRVLKRSQAGEGIVAALTPEKEDDATFFKRIQEVTRKMIEEDEFT
jgi:SNF2 family DNA or RNA helicase